MKALYVIMISERGIIMVITQLTNFTEKSFKSYSTPNNYFKPKNIIFGYNGRGKSSLAKGIVDTFINNGGSENSVRFFNASYIENVLLEPSGSGINGVKVSFSENDANIAKQISIFKSQINDVDADETTCSKNRESLREQIDSIHTSKKGKANINRKKAKLTIEEVLEQYKIDLDEALRINKSKEFIRNFSEDSEILEKRKQDIINATLPTLIVPEFSSDDIDFLRKSLGKKYQTIEEIPSSEIIKWIENGIRLHSENDSDCKFCNNSFNLHDVIDKLEEYNQNSIQTDRIRLEMLKNRLSESIESIVNSEKTKQSLSIIGLTNEEIDQLFDIEYTDEVRRIIEVINNKILDMSQIFEIDSTILFFESKINKVIERMVSQRNHQIKELETTILNIEKITKGALAIALEDSTRPLKLKAIQEKESEILALKEKNKEIKEKIRELEEGQSEYIDFMIFLNEVLLSLGVQIKLILDDSKYYLIHSIDGVNLSINSISEGEKNLLAILYFYFELYKDREQKDLLDELELIVIDDPISSFDEANKFYVLEMMKKIISENNIQIFLFTHSWDDFCQLSYGKTNNDDFGLFEIFKNPNIGFCSALRRCQSNITPYKKLFLEVYELHNKSVEQLNNCDIYHAANSMRRIFEEFLNFKKPNLLPQKSNQDKIQLIFFDATGNELGSNRKRKLGSLLSFINVLSHRPIKSEEIIENSKTLMNLIRDIDKVHFNEMKKGI